jgi:hypothetical protein
MGKEVITLLYLFLMFNTTFTQVQFKKLIHTVCGNDDLNIFFLLIFLYKYYPSMKKYLIKLSVATHRFNKG